jgi:outer membrane protein assembly factor BamB
MLSQSVNEAHAPPLTFRFSLSGIKDAAHKKPESTYRGGLARLGLYQETEKVVASRLKKEWEFPILNAGIHSASKSSPAVDATGIYVGTDGGVFYAFDFSGKVRWSFTTVFAARGIHGTALTDGDTVYFGAYNGRFYALNKADGSMRWVAYLADAVGSSPLMQDGSIYVSAETAKTLNGFAFKIDARSGQVQWRSQPFGEQVHSSVALEEAGPLLFVGANNGSFNAIDKMTGHLKWQMFAGDSVKSTPLITRDRVFFTSWDQNVWAVDAKTGNMLWRTALGAKSQSSPAWSERENLLIVNTSKGHVLALDPENGHIAWRKNGVGLNITSPLVLARSGLPSRIFTQCSSKLVCLLDASTGQTIWEMQMNAELTSTPVAYDGAIYLALDFPGALIKLR